MTPEKPRGRPTAGAAPSIADDDAASLQRRRDAALRLPPLASGHRDPLDALAGLPVGADWVCHGVERGSNGWRRCCCNGAGAA